MHRAGVPVGAPEGRGPESASETEAETVGSVRTQRQIQRPGQRPRRRQDQAQPSDSPSPARTTASRSRAIGSTLFTGGSSLSSQSLPSACIRSSLKNPVPGTDTRTPCLAQIREGWNLFNRMGLGHEIPKWTASMFILLSGCHHKKVHLQFVCIGRDNAESKYRP